MFTAAAASTPQVFAVGESTACNGATCIAANACHITGDFQRHLCARCNPNRANQAFRLQALHAFELYKSPRRRSIVAKT